MNWDASLERLRDRVHRIHGTRSLLASTLALLVLTIIEPAIPQGWPRALLTFPVFVLGLIGLLTLPREAVAVQARLRRLVSDPAAGRRLAVDLAFPFILVVLLLPQSFLTAYGIPHFSPLTGLILPSLQRRLAAFFLFGLLMVPVLHLRRTARYAPDVQVVRPQRMDATDILQPQRDILVILTLGVMGIWLAILSPFWAPFSLLSWPPSMDSFGQGVRAVSALAYSIFLPAILFTHLAAHAQGLRFLMIHARWRTHPRRFVALWLHVAFGLAAIGLHVYDLLWIVRYQTAVGF